MQYIVFSYNRGQFLENCIKSIEVCSPNSKITIFDDNSSDSETQKILDQYKSVHTVIQPAPSDAVTSKFGGLYANMQMALNKLPSTGLACFLQDDMQMVRLVNSIDIACFNRFFEEYKNAALIHPAFLKAQNRMRDIENVECSHVKGVYFRKHRAQSAGVNFSAIVICCLDRLKNQNWQFEAREKLNDDKCERCFGRMGFLSNPFCAWLPYVPAFRGKSKTIALKIAERVRNCGFHPYKILDEDRLDALVSAGEDTLPFAEDYLELRGINFPKPWRHNPLEGFTVLKHLNRFELRFRVKR